MNIEEKNLLIQEAHRLLDKIEATLNYIINDIKAKKLKNE